VEEAAEVPACKENVEEFVVAETGFDGAEADARTVRFGEAADGVRKFGETVGTVAVAGEVATREDDFPIALVEKRLGCGERFLPRTRNGLSPRQRDDAVRAPESASVLHLQQGALVVHGMRVQGPRS
jgi:hypothetical protein